MRWTIIRTIWFREVRDQLRDRRTLFMLVVLPLLLYPLIGIAMLYFSTLFAGQQLTIGVAGYELIQQEKSFPQLVDEQTTPMRFAAALFQDAEDRNLLRVVTAPAAQVEEMLKNGEVQAGLFFDERFVRHVKHGQQAQVDVRLKDSEILAQAKSGRAGLPPAPLINSDDDRSRLAYQRLRDVIREWAGEIARKRMTDLILPADYTRPLIVPVLKSKTEQVWSRIFPFLIIMMSLTGALYPAIDVCAGEKERGTMETLLISPANRSEIVVGKFLTVWIFSAAMALLNLGSLAFTALQFSSMFNEAPNLTGAAEGLPAPGVTAVLWCVVLLIPLAGFFSAICLALAVYARSSKEGQYYLMPLMVATMMLTFLSLAPGIELSPALSLLPVTGAALLLQSLMNARSPEQLPWLYLFPVLVPLASYCYIALHWAIVQFNREEVLFREAERLDLRLWLARVFREKQLLPSPAMALTCFFFILLVHWFIGMRLGQTPVLQATAILQITLLGVAALMAVLLTTSPRLTLRLRWPSFATRSAGVPGFVDGMGWAGSVLVWGLGAVALALALHGPLLSLVALIVHQLPALREQLEGKEELVRQLFSDQTPVIAQLLVVAGLPAVCEEVVFRGFILSGLARRTGLRRAIIISSILFAFAHLAAFQFVPTFFLGLILALLATRSGSLLPGIVFHFTHNGLLTLYAHFRLHPDERWSWLFPTTSPDLASSESWLDLFPSAGLYSLPVVTFGLVVGVALLVLLYRLPPRPLLDETEPAR